MPALDPILRENLAQLPATLGGHVLLSLAAILTGVAVSVPLGIVASRSRAIGGAGLAVAGVVQTIPSLALLAVMVPLFAVALAPLGLARYATGFWPAYAALCLYSVLPILRNTVVGLAGVDADATEAARGVGMTDAQLLRRVQLPLAAPAIVAGIRTAAVFTVGVATLATPVGATCLGDHIFGGLATRRWATVLFGCLFAAGLALAIDGLIRLMEIAVARRSRPLGWTAGLMTTALVAATTAYPLSVIAADLLRPDPPIVVGGKPFAESYILAEAVADLARAGGRRAAVRKNLGSTILYDALRAGSLDAYVEYTGTIWATEMRRTDQPGPAAVLEGAAAHVKQNDGITLLGPVGFENTYALAMRRADADRLGVRTIADLAPHAARLRFGTDFEFLDRPEWAAIQQGYGLAFADVRRMAPDLMYPAVANGAVDVITAYSTDGQIVANDLLVLLDEKRVLPPYDAVLLLSARAAADEALVAALQPLVNGIDADAMRRANAAVVVDGRTPEAVGRDLAAAARGR